MQLPGGSYFSIIALLNQPLDERIFFPRQYLSASHEVFAITLIATWAITLIFYPEQIFEHPARPIIGSFNPCFGWDYPPASYLALVSCSVNVFLTWRYAWLEHTRTRLRNPGALRWFEIFSASACALLAVASNLWLLLWLLGPASTGKLNQVGPLTPVKTEDVSSWFLHTGLFIIYASGSYLACLGNYLEVTLGNSGRGSVGTKHTVFIAVYGFAASFRNDPGSNS